jgi:ribonuclease HI
VPRLPREQKRESNRVLDTQGPYAIFTDGSSYYKNGSGGWAYVIIDSFNGEEIGSGYVSDTTNNRMEMQAWVEGLNYLVGTLGPCDVLVYSDSQYVGYGAMDRTRKRKKNCDLWNEIDEAIEQHRSVEFVWVKGHHESHYNKLVDELAGNARRKGLETS